MTAEQVLDKFTVPEPNSGCLLWAGARINSGYGNYGGTTAHRWVYERMVGPIPEGLELHHKCNTRPCVNPSHLQPVTRAQNIHAFSDLKTKCIRGHALVGENLHHTPQGWRQCRECQRLRTQNWRLKNPDRNREIQLGWIERNPGRRTELHRQWVQKNPERTKELQRLGRLRRKEGTNA